MKNRIVLTPHKLPPCKDCKERFTACHDKCPKDKRGEYCYKAWKSELCEKKEQIKEAEIRLGYR
jgi:hypothetical protein